MSDDGNVVFTIIDGWLQRIRVAALHAGVDGRESTRVAWPRSDHDDAYPFSPDERNSINENVIARGGRPNDMPDAIVIQRRTLAAYRQYAAAFVAPMHIVCELYASAQRLRFPAGVRLEQIQAAIQQSPHSSFVADVLGSPFELMERMTAMVRSAVMSSHYQPARMVETNPLKHDEYYEPPPIGYAVRPADGRVYVRPTGDALLGLSAFLGKIADYNTFIDEALARLPRSCSDDQLPPMTIEDFRKIANIASPTRPFNPYAADPPTVGSNGGTGMGNSVTGLTMYAISPLLCLPLASIWFVCARGAMAFDTQNDYMGITGNTFPASAEQVNAINGEIARTEGLPAHVANFMQWSEKYACYGIFPIPLEVARAYVSVAPSAMFSVMVNVMRRLWGANEPDWRPHTYRVSDDLVLPEQPSKENIANPASRVAVRRTREQV